MNNMLLNLQAMGKQTNELGIPEEVVNMIMAASNPIAELQQMAASDPRMQEVVSVINQNGGIQQAVYAMAKQKGIDPNSALQQARSMLQNIRR